MTRAPYLRNWGYIMCWGWGEGFPFPSRYYSLLYGLFTVKGEEWGCTFNVKGWVEGEFNGSETPVFSYHSNPHHGW